MYIAREEGGGKLEPRNQTYCFENRVEDHSVLKFRVTSQLDKRGIRIYKQNRELVTQIKITVMQEDTTLSRVGTSSMEGNRTAEWKFWTSLKFELS